MAWRRTLNVALFLLFMVGWGAAFGLLLELASGYRVLHKYW